MAPVDGTTMPIILPQWLRNPFPPFIFSMLNMLSPLALPAAAFIAMSFTYAQMQSDMLGAMMDSDFRNPYHYEEYDFIVIGGGSAGAVVANRLSKHSTVLLLEAGGNPHPLSLVPIALSMLITQPTVDWQYSTEPQRYAAFGFKENRAVWPRGKSLGGSSILNAMIYMRGNPRDFDNWANITSDESWMYQNLLPFFKKIETYSGNYPNNKFHGTDGPIHVEPLRHAPGLNPMLQAVREMGYKVFDLNSYQQEGFMATEMTTKRGIRSDVYRRYLRPLERERKNLKISRFSYVHKIHLDRRRRAYGVTYVRHGMVKFVRARREVIVSAGAINSPHLLLLSGIGPREHLHSKGLPCRVNLPVGSNLQDHPLTFVGPILVNKSVSILPDRDLSIATGFEYLMGGKGALSFIPASSTGLLSTSFTDPSWPDVFIHQTAVTPHTGSSPLIRVAEDALGFKPGLFANYLQANEGKDAYFNGIALGRPHSRGEIRLRSRDPFEKPLIDPRYFSDPRDMETLVQGIRKTLDIFQSAPSFQRMRATLAHGPLRGCDIYEFNTDAYWECYARTITMTIYHPCCTCPMGKRVGNDTSAVVNSEFRVFKTRNLRVIDASIMPVITNANLNAPTIMIGEKGSHVIRSYWAEQFLVSDAMDHFKNPAMHDLRCYYSKFV